MGLREAKDLLITVKDKEEREEMIAVLKREADHCRTEGFLIGSE